MQFKLKRKMSHWPQLVSRCLIFDLSFLTNADVVTIKDETSKENLWNRCKQACRSWVCRVCHGTPNISADQLTLFQPGGTDYAHLITTGIPRFSDLPTALVRQIKEQDWSEIVRSYAWKHFYLLVFWCFVFYILLNLLIFENCFRYPKETMELVEELAFGVVQEYREQQKGRLQRTFVSGSTAAAGKVNRGKPGVPKETPKWEPYSIFYYILQIHPCILTIEFMNCNLVQKRKSDDNKSEQQPAAKKFQYNMFVSAGTSGSAENDKKEEKKEYDPRQMAATPSQLHATPSQFHATPSQQHKHPLPVVSSIWNPNSGLLENQGSPNHLELLD